MVTKLWKKTWVVLLLFSLVVFLATGCGGSGSEGTGTDEQSGGEKQEVVALTLAHNGSTEYSSHHGAEKFRDLLEEKTGGKYTVTIFPGGQMGGERQQWEGIMTGTLDMTISSTGPLPAWFPQFQVFDFPYLFTNEAQADAVLDGPLGTEMFALLETKGIKPLSWMENGFRNFTNDTRPLVEPEDLKGLKIRVMENPLMMDTIRLLGADPTPIPFNELYTALQQGVVDGQENPINLIYTSKFHEVQKYLTVSGHFYSPYILAMNKAKFESFPADVQNAIIEAAMEARLYQREVSRRQVAEYLDKMIEEKGLEVVTLTDEQKQKWAEATLPIYEQYKDKIGLDLYEKIMSEVKNK